MTVKPKGITKFLRQTGKHILYLGNLLHKVSWFKFRVFFQTEEPWSKWHAYVAWQRN